MPWGSGGCGWGMGWGPGWHGGLFMLLFWGAIIAVGFRLLRGSAAGRWAGVPGTPGPETPLEILRRRYAAGEIDKTEFDQRRRDLGV